MIGPAAKAPLPGLPRSNSMILFGFEFEICYGGLAATTDWNFKFTALVRP
jgi:hypothetical protein